MGIEAHIKCKNNRLPEEMHHKSCGHRRYGWRHDIHNLGTCKILKTCLCIIQPGVSRTMTSSVRSYDSNIDRGLLATILALIYIQNYTLGPDVTAATHSVSEKWRLPVARFLNPCSISQKYFDILQNTIWNDWQNCWLLFRKQCIFLKSSYLRVAR